MICETQTDGGGKGFDTAMNRPQAQCYVVIRDFVYLTDRYGREYGWGVAEYATPEMVMGPAFPDAVYQRRPEESRWRIEEHLRTLLPQTEAAIRRFLN